MLKLGVIGTGWISKQFVEAIQENGSWELTSVFSRSIEKAEKFGKELGLNITGYRDLEQFFLVMILMLSILLLPIVYILNKVDKQF